MTNNDRRLAGQDSPHFVWLNGWLIFRSPSTEKIIGYFNSAEASERDLDIDVEAAREIVYGMPYAEWKAKYQTEATAEQKEKYKQSHQ